MGISHVHFARLHIYIMFMILYDACELMGNKLSNGLLK